MAVSQVQFLDKVMVIFTGAAVAAHLSGRWLPCRGAEAFPMDQTIQPILEISPVAVHSCRGHRCSSVVGDVAVLPQRQVTAVGLDSWDEV